MQKEINQETTQILGKNEKAFEFEHSLPEYMNGISSIVGCDISCSTPVLSSGELTTTVKICVIYACDFDGKIKTGIFREHVSLALQNDLNADSECLFIPACYVTNASAKAISSRKVSTKFMLCYSLSCVCNENISLFEQDSIDGVCTKTQLSDYCQKVTLEETVFEKQAEINIGASAEVGEIIYCNAQAQDLKSTCDDGKIDFEFTLDISCLYMTANDEDGTTPEFALANTKVKVNDTVSSDKVTNNSLSCLCVDILSIDSSVSFDSFGENKTIGLVLKYGIGGFIYECKQIELVTDAFSTEYTSEAEYNTLFLDNVKDSLSQNISITETLRGDTGHISQPLFCSCQILSLSNEQSEGKHFAAVKCNVKIFGLDENGSLVCIDKQANLHIPLWEKDMSHSQTPFVLLTPQGCTCIIKNGEFICDLTFFASGVMLETSEVNTVQKLLTDTDNPCGKKGGELIIYYPASDDTLWTVAKKYKVNPELLGKANGIENDNVSGKNIILIP